MAKSSSTKHRNPSVHSRAARREASPADKSLIDAADKASESRPVKQFPVHHFSGISKKKSKPKALSRAQRLRRQKGMERAEAVVDQLEVKKASSMVRGKKIKVRNAAWEDLNGKIIKSRTNKFALPADDDEWENQEDDDDEDQAPDATEKQAIDAVEALHLSSLSKLAPATTPAVTTDSQAELDEIL